MGSTSRIRDHGDSNFYFTHEEHDDHEAGQGDDPWDGDQHLEDGLLAPSPRNPSPAESPRWEGPHGGFHPHTAPHIPHWPQSYKASMDAFMHSPSISSLRSPHFHLAGALHSPTPSFRRRSSSRLLPPRDGETTASEFAQPPPQLTPVPSQDLSLSARIKPKVGEKPSVAVPHVPSAKEAIVEEDTEEYYYYEAAPEGGSTFLQALFNGWNILAGVGVLSTPYGVQQGGWLGLLFLLLLAVICCYTGVMLRHCLEHKDGLASYPDIGEAAFGRYGRLLISIVLYVELYACTVEFLILEGDNLSVLYPDLTLDLGFVFLEARTLFVLITALLVLPTVWLRDLSYLSYISAGGVVASILIVGTVAWVGVVDKVGFHHTGQWINWSTLPVSVGLYGFCYSGHAVFPSIYMSMQDKKQYDKVLIVSFVLCTIIYGGIAVMGYKMFGDEVDSQITLNLPENLVASNVAIWITVVNPFTKYALTMMPVALCLEELLPMNPDSFAFHSVSLVIRTSLVASTVAVALLVPFFGYVMAFIGSFLSMAVSVMLPCACYLAILGKRASTTNWIVSSLIILIGFLAAIAGTMSAIDGIAKSWDRHHAHKPTPAPT